MSAITGGAGKGALPVSLFVKFTVPRFFPPAHRHSEHNIVIIDMSSCVSSAQAEQDLPGLKYILVSGGVISGIGKGVITSSIGTLLKSNGLRVTAIKIDPYLNIDAGTFSPYEHGKRLCRATMGAQPLYRVNDPPTLQRASNRFLCHSIATAWQPPRWTFFCTKMAALKRMQCFVQVPLYL